MAIAIHHSVILFRQCPGGGRASGDVAKPKLVQLTERLLSNRCRVTSPFQCTKLTAPSFGRRIISSAVICIPSGAPQAEPAVDRLDAARSRTRPIAQSFLRYRQSFSRGRDQTTEFLTRESRPTWPGVFRERGPLGSNATDPVMGPDSSPTIDGTTWLAHECDWKPRVNELGGRRATGVPRRRRVDQDRGLELNGHFTA